MTDHGRLSLCFPTDPYAAIADFLDCLGEKPSRLLVAVSGGSDSLGLLCLLHQALSARAHPAISLCAATIDHALRPEAAAEAQRVAALCADLRIPHLISRWDGDKPRTGISAAAREARYHLLMDAADALGADVILTAHTADDQRETLAMRAARSADEAALGRAGIAPATLIGGRTWVLRPLLATRRADIRDALMAMGRAWIDDPSNTDDRYERVRIRKTLDDETAGGSLASASESAAAEAYRRHALACAAADMLRIHATLPAGLVLRLADPVLACDQQVLRYLLGGVLALMGGNTHRPPAAALDRLSAWLHATRPGSRLTVARCVVTRARDAFYLCREARNLPTIRLQAGQTALWDGRFRVVNAGASEIRIAPGAVPNEICALKVLPPRLAALASKSAPQVLGGDSTQQTTEVEEAVEITAHHPAFENFLPCFDLPFADAARSLYGLPPLPRPPGKIVAMCC